VASEITAKNFEYDNSILLSVSIDKDARSLQISRFSSSYYNENQDMINELFERCSDIQGFALEKTKEISSYEEEINKQRKGEKKSAFNFLREKPDNIKKKIEKAKSQQADVILEFLISNKKKLQDLINERLINISADNPQGWNSEETRLMDDLIYELRDYYNAKPLQLTRASISLPIVGNQQQRAFSPDKNVSSIIALSLQSTLQTNIGGRRKSFCETHLANSSKSAPPLLPPKPKDFSTNKPNAQTPPPIPPRPLSLTESNNDVQIPPPIPPRPLSLTESNNDVQIPPPIPPRPLSLTESNNNAQTPLSNTLLPAISKTASTNFLPSDNQSRMNNSAQETKLMKANRIFMDAIKRDPVFQRRRPSLGQVKLKR